MMVLTSNAFANILGQLDVWSLRKALKEIDIVPVEDRLFRVIHEMKSDASNAHLNYEHYLRAVQLHVQPGKCRETHVRDDNETRKTFVFK
jgi:hypothetical protein